REVYYGTTELEMFDYIGPVLIGFFIFFFVFLISGVSFLRERTTGTLERLLATPIARYELVFGYLIGYGLFTIVQSLIIAFYCTYVLGVYNVGGILLITFICVLIALSALSLGTFLSSYANNELQMMQFIPLIIVPQVFFSGMFPVEGMVEPLQWLAAIMPLTYGAHALTDVMMKGATLGDVWTQLGILFAFTVVFASLNIVALKKHRTW
ncbi:MAG: ABC transporter permease, partial [Bacilli bacterium]